MTVCCVPGCSKRTDVNSKEVSFYRIPLKPEWRRKAFIDALGREPSWEPTGSTRICSAHFVGKRKEDFYSSPSYIPTLNLPLWRSEVKSVYRRKNRKPETVLEEPQISSYLPTLNIQSYNEPSQSYEAKHQIAVDGVEHIACDAIPPTQNHYSTEHPLDKFNPTNFPETSKSHIVVENNSVIDANLNVRVIVDHSSCCQMGFDTDFDNQLKIKRLQQYILSLKKKIVEMRAKHICLQNIKSNPPLFEYYTGFSNYNVFESLFIYLRPRIKLVQKWKNSLYLKTDYKIKQKNTGKILIIPLRDEFFVVLNRLKTGAPAQAVIQQYGLSKKYFYQIFNSWLSVMVLELQPNNKLPLLGKKLLSTPLWESGSPTTDVMVDCSDMFSQRVVSVDNKAEERTLEGSKFLLELTSAGIIAYVCLQGNKSTPSWMKKTNFFNIKRTFKNQNSLNNSVSFETLQVKVQHALECIQNYQILSGSLNLAMQNSVQKIISVCAYLANFSLMNKD